MAIKKLPTNEIIKHELDANSMPIRSEVIDKILGLIVDEYQKIKGSFKLFEVAKCSAENDWVWSNKRGSLPKRLESWYFKYTNGGTLGEELISKIGNVVRTEIPKSQVYYFDVTDEFHWKVGDFGDHRSCFFDDVGLPGYQLKEMENDGRYKAIRFFKPVPAFSSISNLNKFYEADDQFYVGISRAWLFEEDCNTTINNQHVTGPIRVVFNGYGITTSKITTILSNYLGTSSHYIMVETSPVYINDNGYVLGEEPLIKDMRSIRFTGNEDAEFGFAGNGGADQW